MGAPLSPVLADLIMENLEEECLSSLDFPIKFLYRYVDDILLCAPTDKTEEILDRFNNFHNRLQFTMESENEHRQNSFLNLQLQVVDNNIVTNWYRKPTWSGRVLNYMSHHPSNQKVAMVYSLVDQAVDLSNQKFHQENIDSVKKTLINNKYPSSFVGKYIDKRIHNKNNVNTTNNLDNPVFVSFPFSSKVHNRISHSLKKIQCKM